MPRTIEVTELILRDAHQSLLATRMALEDMLPACGDIDKAGFWSVECWGGATFDACIRVLNEDPRERLRAFRKLLPNRRLQMLLRGQNLLGYRHYEDTVVDRFVARAADNGMDVFRVFDALNDVRNVKRAIAAVKKAGKHAQGTICYTVSAQSGAAVVPANPTASTRAAADAAADEDNVCRSPVAGIAMKSNVGPGQTILPADLLFVLESMKMETEMTATAGGKVGEVKVSVGESVKSGQVVLTWV
jgi:pyruvate/oxaloacetate carboxyltransferase